MASPGKTRGGISFDQLCRGEDVYYVCDRECLVNITNRDTMEKAERKLVDKIESLFVAIETEKDVEIDKFYVGKTYVQQNQTSKKLEHLNPSTWEKDGIRSRWGTHKDRDYGKHGMIVIAVITRSQVPNTRDLIESTPQEDYALQLERRLLEYYDKDQRLSNETLKKGRRDSKQSAGYALYVAFSYKMPMKARMNLSYPRKTRNTGLVVAMQQIQIAYSYTEYRDEYTDEYTDESDESDESEDEYLQPLEDPTHMIRGIMQNMRITSKR